jgi:hypothetical protein
MAPDRFALHLDRAVAKARATGGELVLRPGGFWTFPGCPDGQPFMGKAVPEWNVGEGLIDALIEAGRLEAVDWTVGGKPCRVRLTEGA